MQHWLGGVLMSVGILGGVAADAAAEKKEAPYGTWSSPLDAQLVARAATYLMQPQLDRGRVYWLERRPADKGRATVVERDEQGRLRDITPATMNVRTTVHEYGGGDYALQDGVLWFSNYADQRLYTQRVDGGEPVALTPADGSRWADCVPDLSRKRLICVRELHGTGAAEAKNGIAAVPLDGGAPSWLWQNSDFAANPRLEQNGNRLAWIGWDHPNMPWDAATLWVASFAADGTLQTPRKITSGAEAVSDPRFLPDGAVAYLSDRDGWWNLWRWNPDGTTKQVTSLRAEIGGAAGLGRHYWSLLPGNKAIATVTRDAIDTLERIDLATGKTQPIALPWRAARSLAGDDNHAVFIGGSPTRGNEIVRVDLKTGTGEAIRPAKPLDADTRWISRSEAISFPTAGNQVAHAFYYPPTSPTTQAPAGEKPPLLVFAHGGPTGHVVDELKPKFQFWTSRGFAVVDVNYGGSTGFGRDYRKRLAGQWGVVDVNDVVAAAQYLVAQGKADPKRLIITGGSAGGFTTLAALSTRDVFAAGSNQYGVSDLRALDLESHKYESHYTQSLIGPWPQSEALYRERSPIFHADRIKKPLITLQGLEDKVVPPNQSEMIVEAVRKNGVPVAYLPFPGEQHGFRQAEHLRQALEAELYFFGRVLGFSPADPLPAIKIENLADH